MASRLGRQVMDQCSGTVTIAFERIFFTRGATYIARLRQMDFLGARAPFEANLDIARRLNRVDPDNLDWHLELSYASSDLGSVSQSLGNFAALEHFQSSLTIDRRLVEDNLAFYIFNNGAWQYYLFNPYIRIEAS